MLKGKYLCRSRRGIFRLHSYIWASLLRFFPPGPGSYLCVLHLMAFPYSSLYPEPPRGQHTQYTCQFVIGINCVFFAFFLCSSPKCCRSKGYLFYIYLWFQLVAVHRWNEYSPFFPPEFQNTLVFHFFFLLHLVNVKEVV